MQPTEKKELVGEFSEQEVADANLLRNSFHGEWNYTILPREKSEGDVFVS